MFERARLLPPDPILGLSQAARNDPRTDKVDLGVGVYRTSDGRTPVLDAVQKAQQQIVSAEITKAYTPPEGAPGFGDAVMKLVLGEDSQALAEKRCASVQTPGGCGAVRLAGELLKRLDTGPIIIGAPTWANHEPLLRTAGNVISMAPYYDKAQSTLEFDAFYETLKGLSSGDVVLLHGGCHNPTGADLSHDQCDAVLDTAIERGLLVLIDTAYHGFAENLEDDAYLVREAARRLPEVLISYSCSKNFGLYRERTGALIIIGKDENAASTIKSHALNIARESWSMPPAHGGLIVSEILQSSELTGLWKDELAQMAATVKNNRKALAAAAREVGLGNRFAYIETQNGMFSMLPVTPDQVAVMKSDYGIYLTDNGRINICGVNSANASAIAEALARVL